MQDIRIDSFNRYIKYNIVDELLFEEDIDITEIINKLDLYNK